jgi:hypothetical protein
MFIKPFEARPGLRRTTIFAIAPRRSGNFRLRSLFLEYDRIAEQISVKWVYAIGRFRIKATTST